MTKIEEIQYYQDIIHYRRTVFYQFLIIFCTAIIFMQGYVFLGHKRPITASLFFIITVLPFLLCIIITFTAYVKIIIDRNSLKVQKYPLERRLRNIKFDDIIKTEIVKISSISEKKASWLQDNKKYPIIYYVNQRSGVMISLSNGERLFIGSSRPEELNKVIMNKMHNVNAAEEKV